MPRLIKVVLKKDSPTGNNENHRKTGLSAEIKNYLDLFDKDIKGFNDWDCELTIAQNIKQIIIKKCRFTTRWIKAMFDLW